MESNITFHKYPSKKYPQSLHQCNIIINKKKQKWKKKNTQCFTLLLPLLICYSPFVVSSPSWDGITLTKSNLQALKSFKQELIDTHGFLKSWNDSGYGACSGGWVGIKCVQGLVIVIQLPWRGLGGQLTSDIGQLQALRKLSLHDNAIGGSIPKELGFLPNLKGIQLFNNKLTGSIPHTLGSCILLQNLDFSHNQLDNKLPTEFGNLVKLQSLNLSYNFISGGIPNSFSILTSLTSLNLAHNNLSGHVPIQLCSRFNSSSFSNNLELCGYSPSTMCPVSQAESHHQKTNTKDVLIVSGVGLIAVLLLVCCMLLWWLLKKEDTVKQLEDMEQTVGPTKENREAEEGGGRLVCFDGGVEFTADDLLCASVEMMGKGSYGTVYKARLVGGCDLVVKRLRDTSMKNQDEFQDELNSVGIIRHENLLAMRAYYLGPNGEKLLVFDYMHKGSLASFLHVREPHALVDWPTRMKIMKGITRGLLNLHTHHNIIHGHLTSNNILLDDDHNPKIADYGLSWLMTVTTNSNMIATTGAHGYQAPELSKLNKANTKTDIYSLGVIMLELLTGKSPHEVDGGVGLPQWVALIVNKEWTNEVFDLELMKDGCAIGNELLKTLKLALHCVDPSPAARPEVQIILQQLDGISSKTATGSCDEGGGGQGRTY